MKSRQSKTRLNQLRIIGGEWRGRKLPILNKPGLRPTGDRVRETLFNWLMPHIHNSVCLDLFAGTGALGFEALSRGAQATHFIEIDRDICQQLQKNLTLLHCNKSNVHCVDALSWLEHIPLPKCSVDVVFLDPPFAKAFWEAALEKLVAGQWLKPSALIYIEQPGDTTFTLPARLQLLKDKTSGQVRYSLYQHITPT